jgi:serine protease Do
VRIKTDILAAVVTSWLMLSSVAQAEPLPENLASLVQVASPAVVSISVVRERSSDGQDGRFLGSGFVVDATGFIVTNNHVIEKAREIYVSFVDGRRRAATLVGVDRKSDLALLRVPPGSTSQALPLGDSDDTRPGDWVLAIGNPFGLGGSVSAGIVSARNRQLDSDTYDDFIQTDVAINRGSSGGPLLNLKGEVVGVNSALISPNGGSAGVSFAIPANTLRFVVSRLKTKGSVQRGWIGANVLDLTPDLAEAFDRPSAAGALVGDVVASGPAAKAGLVPGDIITQVGTKPVSDSRQVQRLIAEADAGSALTLSLLRKRASVKAQLVVAHRPPDAGREASPSAAVVNEKRGTLGLHLDELTPAMRSKLALGTSVPALLVRAVDGASPGAEADIRPGDLVLEIDQKPAPTLKGLKTSVTTARSQGKKFILVTLLRGGETVFKALRMSEQRFNTALTVPRK